MSADFWAGYVSGAAGILIGNPLDVVKVRLQAGSAPSAASAASSGPPLSGPPTATPAPAPSSLSYRALFPRVSSLAAGTAAPVLGYGALNALLFVSYNRVEAFLSSPSRAQSALGVSDGPQPSGPSLWTTWLAGAAGGLATWVVSAPTEVVKCRAQMATGALSAASVASAGVGGGAGYSSWQVFRRVLSTEGVRGLYLGGTVTAVRDSVGYGFYFWAYELGSRWWSTGGSGSSSDGMGGNTSEAARVLLCGGVAGIVTWASIFPLDVIKTRVQAQPVDLQSNHDGYRDVQVRRAATGTMSTAPLLLNRDAGQVVKRKGTIQTAREAYAEGGLGIFFRGLGVCSVRAFIVNAVQWAVYEWIMSELGRGRDVRVRERDGMAAVDAML